MYHSQLVTLEFEFKQRNWQAHQANNLVMWELAGNPHLHDHIMKPTAAQ